MSYPIDNSIFLLARWWHRGLSALVLTLSVGALAGQSTSIAVSPAVPAYALESPHFRIVAAPRAVRAAEKALQHLEKIRAALIELHGESWSAEGVLHVWLPEDRRQFRAAVREDYEQGVFLSGPRLNWIVIHPDAAKPEEVLTHEYLHAILHRNYRGLPRWIEEGVCEYYASLRLVTRKYRDYWEAGVPPGNRLAVLSRSEEFDVKRLSGRDFPPEAYAWAWAHIHLAARDADLPTLLAALATKSTAMKWRMPSASAEFPARLWPATKPAPASPRRLTEHEALELRALAAEAFETLGGPPQGEAEFLEGVRLFDEGKTLDARPVIERAVRLRPAQSTWWLTLAYVYAELDLPFEFEGAIAKAFQTAANGTERSAAESLRRRYPPKAAAPLP